VEAFIDRLVWRIAHAMAILGGIVLVALVLMTVASVVGRNLNFLGLAPIPGDFELVEAGAAFAVFAFLPWCQLNRGHITVDLFLVRLGRRRNAIVDVVGNALMTIAAAVIAWRLALGLIDRYGYGQTSFILQFPLWWSYAASLIGAVVFAAISAWTVWRSLREATGRTVGDGGWSAGR